LSAELTGHLGYEPHREPPGGIGNTRNGSTAKTLATEHGPVEVRTPRDRDGSFEPQLVRKGQRRRRRFPTPLHLRIVRLPDGAFVVATCGRPIVQGDRDDAEAAPAFSESVAVAERALDQRLEVVAPKVGAAPECPHLDVSTETDFGDRFVHDDVPPLSLLATRRAARK
jgi:hypothetical protein